MFIKFQKLLVINFFSSTLSDDNESDTVESALADLYQLIRDSLNKIKILTENIQNLTNEIKNMKSEIEPIKNELIKIKKESDTQSNTINDLQKMIEKSTNDTTTYLESLEKELSAIALEKNQYIKNISEFTKCINGIQSNLDKLKQSTNELQNKDKSSESEKNKTNSIIDITSISMNPITNTKPKTNLVIPTIDNKKNNNKTNNNKTNTITQQKPTNTTDSTDSTNTTNSTNTTSSTTVKKKSILKRPIKKPVI